MPRKPKPSPEIHRSTFPIGSEVEVRSDEDGFLGSWFEATVTRVRSKKGRYSVTYSTLVSSDGDPLREVVPGSMVRPRPPRPGPKGCYGLHHLVDAFHNDGWWAGVVTGLPGGGRDRYAVCFPMSREEFEFRASELRGQVEWVKGNWVYLQDQGGADAMFKVGTHVEVSRDIENCGSAWFVGTVLKVIGKKSFLVEYENLRLDGRSGTLLKEIVDFQFVRPPPPASKSEKFKVLDEVEAFCGDGWYGATVETVLPGERYIVTSNVQDKMELDHSSVRSLCFWTKGRWLHISQDKQAKSRRSERGIRSVDHSLKSNGGMSLPVLALTSSEENIEDADGSNFVTPKRKQACILNAECQIESPYAPKKPRSKSFLQERSHLADCVLSKCSSEAEIDATYATSSYSGNLFLANPEHHQADPKRILASPGECTHSENEITFIPPCSSEPTVLPFTKKTRLWDVIRSEEAFNMMPQQPHFRQLEKYPMELREGMAIGLMVVYTNLLREIRELDAGKSPNIFEDKLKALDSLESNGFNVRPLEVRIKKLREISSKLLQSQSERVELEAHLFDRVAEKDRNSILCLALDKLISEWEERVNSMRTKRASVVSNMADNDSEVLCLERAARAAEEAVVSATQEYNAAQAAPW